MKVTVCFGHTRVVVPCGNGELPVRQLIEKAADRYRKAIGKSSDYWIHVKNLESDEGGILDADDQLCDVADDREKLIANYDEQDAPPVPHNGGDGTSASSVGTESPDIFQGDHDRGSFTHYEDEGVDVSNAMLKKNTPLIVRRGSEPSLPTIISPISHSDGSKSEDSILQEHNLQSNKRWSTAAIMDDVGNQSGGDPVANSTLIEPKRLQEIKENDRTGGNGGETLSAFSRFGRDSARQSILGNHPSMDRWAEAADHAHMKAETRKEPLGLSSDDSQESSDGSKIVDIDNDGGPLGIHVVPYVDSSGRNFGLSIKNVEEGSKAAREAKLNNFDVIIEINGTSLLDATFDRAQQIFKGAMSTSVVSLRVCSEKPESSKFFPDQPVAEGKPAKPPIPRKPDLSLHDSGERSPDEPMTPTKKVPPSVPPRSPTTTLSKTKPLLTSPTNTRRVGKKIHIQLTKGMDGLGFSVTTRDNPTGRNPIYVKNVMNKGAAVEDGRLKAGDRIMEVNGIELTGKTQQEAVNMLRSIPIGGTVNLVVSRQDEPVLPRELPEDYAVSDAEDPRHGLTPRKTREYVTLEIPLNDTGSAGLGVSVKGNKSKVDGADLGIFIKSIINGGAASKDGQLKVNDQLLYVNGESLVALPNNVAMEKLRKSMSTDGNMRGSIQLVVARKIKQNNTLPQTVEEPQNESGSLWDQPVDVGANHTNRSSTPGSSRSGEEIGNGVSTSETSENSDITVVHREIQDSSDEVEEDDLEFHTAHPVLDRLKGQAYGVRNESYQNALGRDSLGGRVTPRHSREHSASSHSNELPMPSPIASNTKVSPTTNMTGETMLIENEGVQERTRKASSQHSGKNTPTLSSSSRSNEEEDLKGGAPEPPEWLVEWDKNHDEKSPGPDDVGIPFTRDGFGRQSMSERHRGVKDAKQTDIYQKRQHKTKSMDLGNSPTRDIGPSLGMKKSSSLESLQTAIQELVSEEDHDAMARPRVKAVRGRACNESFRAAVDRSYEAPLPDVKARPRMETSDQNLPRSYSMKESASESESHSGKEQTSSNRSSLVGDNIVLAETSFRKSGKKKKEGLFKGLGSMFRFGRHRKAEERALENQKEEEDRRRKEQEKQEREREAAYRAAQDEQERIQQKHAELRRKQAMERQQKQLQEQQSMSQIRQDRMQERMNRLRQEYQAKRRGEESSPGTGPGRPKTPDASRYPHPEPRRPRSPELQRYGPAGRAQSPPARLPGPGARPQSPPEVARRRPRSPEVNRYEDNRRHSSIEVRKAMSQDPSRRNSGDILAKYPHYQPPVPQPRDRRQDPPPPQHPSYTPTPRNFSSLPRGYGRPAMYQTRPSRSQAGTPHPDQMRANPPHNYDNYSKPPSDPRHPPHRPRTPGADDPRRQAHPPPTAPHSYYRPLQQREPPAEGPPPYHPQEAGYPYSRLRPVPAIREEPAYHGKRDYYDRPPPPQNHQQYGNRSPEERRYQNRPRSAGASRVAEEERYPVRPRSAGPAQWERERLERERQANQAAYYASHQNNRHSYYDDRPISYQDKHPEGYRSLPRRAHRTGDDPRDEGVVISRAACV
ncbi:PREDICTED: partitioning defective 3 homolog [Branchiostoma belcheri]|uniref:Partitioning defective 3 homolog n=1 Tax=Branchiostoma belcheri TaxID=7741 RepID=A0A6P4Z0L6_BRABE|nr:PREDICTED: partitioning defective 3 homolog [Branchiostoma belcheri]